MTHPQIARALRLMNMEKNGNPTVAEFEALLTDAGRLDACLELMQRPGVLHQLAAYHNLSSALAGLDALIALAPTRADVMRVVSRSPSAMLSLIADQTALSTIFASADVLAAFRASTALASASVPTMTSNTAPTGVASASSEYVDGEYDAWRAFDKTDAHWIADSGANEWLQYKFAGQAFIHTVVIQTYAAPFDARNCRIEYSDDGVSFSTAKTIVLSPASISYIDVSKAGFHKYWRLHIVDTPTNAYIALHELNFIGFAAP